MEANENKHGGRGREKGKKESSLPLSANPSATGVGNKSKFRIINNAHRTNCSVPRFPGGVNQLLLFSPPPVYFLRENDEQIRGVTRGC